MPLEFHNSNSSEYLNSSLPSRGSHNSRLGSHHRNNKYEWLLVFPHRNNKYEWLLASPHNNNNNNRGCHNNHLQECLHRSLQLCNSDNNSNSRDRDKDLHHYNNSSLPATQPT